MIVGGLVLIHINESICNCLGSIGMENQYVRWIYYSPVNLSSGLEQVCVQPDKLKFDSEMSTRCFLYPYFIVSCIY